jgi:hypothetical protein
MHEMHRGTRLAFQHSATSVQVLPVKSTGVELILVLPMLIVGVAGLRRDTTKFSG